MHPSNSGKLLDAEQWKTFCSNHLWREHVNQVRHFRTSSPSDVTGQQHLREMNLTVCSEEGPPVEGCNNTMSVQNVIPASSFYKMLQNHATVVTMSQHGWFTPTSWTVSWNPCATDSWLRSWFRDSGWVWMLDSVAHCKHLNVKC